MLIPRIFHQIWVGPGPDAGRVLRVPADLARHHPGWELKFWTEETFPKPEELRRPEAAEKLRAPWERGDIFRLECLWRWGGVHVDTDFECRRSIEPLIENAEFFIGLRKPGNVNGALMGAVAGHPLLDRGLTEIRPRESYGLQMGAGDANVKDETGPQFLDNILLGRDDVLFIDPPLFYPRNPQAAGEGVRDPPRHALVEGRGGAARLARRRPSSGCTRRRSTRRCGGSARRRPRPALARYERLFSPALAAPARCDAADEALDRVVVARRDLLVVRVRHGAAQHLQVDRDGLLDLVEGERRDAEERAEVGEPAVGGDQAARTGDDPRLDGEVVLRAAAGARPGGRAGGASPTPRGRRARRPVASITTSISSASRSTAGAEERAVLRRPAAGTR